MFLRSSLINVTKQAGKRSIIRPTILSPYMLRRTSLINSIPNVRFKSTDTIEQLNEIQTQLPSLDDMVTSSSTVVEQATHAIGELSNHVGYLNSIGLAQTWHWPADIIQHTLEYVHVYTGLPWWGTICTVTLLVRLAMFPLYVKSSDTIARNSKIKPELDRVTKELMATTDMAEGQKVALRRKKLLSDNGIKNRWLAAPMLQLPVAIGFFNGLRSMANFPVDGFANQGALWFHDLTVADPYLGLQVITAAVLMSFSRLGGETGAQQFSGPMKRFFIILPLVSIPATMNLSAGVVLYFAVNGCFSVTQTLVLRNKWVRKQLKIADVVQHPQSPADANKGIFAAIKDSMAKSREQSERRRIMQEKQEKLQEEAKARKVNSKIKIVRRSDLNK
ncbi:similar to Saccharomyces cerevisiae YER154W OXA1 Mitochondrial inner membrane insertase [Maudiozyma saulgeensis]|uniref:Similar to Saccharomyces cerevisiae YER154W OXA1 Mitochondrial inner membrane insertase n=1 Tax=Maudiozyma saulgeensis TaxID=1789683 RepID=A0A1X7R8W9_9SACH|nr:similar to Saccharomyces cerevisiae YER154W OXA1 Mitochondrial inner membrane insertase [Kazachstania saulgeensis]